jgi:hypothetical protein
MSGNWVYGRLIGGQEAGGGLAERREGADVVVARLARLHAVPWAVLDRGVVLMYLSARRVRPW